MIVLLLALSIPFGPAPITFPPVRVENGVTKVGYQVDADQLSTKFAWRALRKPVKGQGWIALTSGSAKPGLYWVEDTFPVTYPGEPNRYVGGFIVRVGKWQGVKGWLQKPDGSPDYVPNTVRGEARLVAAPILQDVKLEGGSGPLSICLAYRATIRKWPVRDGWDASGLPRAFSVQNSREVRAEDCSVGASALASPGPGRAYAFQSQASTSVTVLRFKARRNRHSASVYGGYDINLIDCVAVEPWADAFETHGYGSRRVTFQNCDWGGSNLSVGNKYPLGDEEVHVVGGRGIKTIYCYGNTTTWLEGVTAGVLWLFTNQAGSPKSVTAWDSTFQAVRYQGEFTGVLELANCLLKENTVR